MLSEHTELRLGCKVMDGLMPIVWIMMPMICGVGKTIVRLLLCLGGREHDLTLFYYKR